MYLDDLLHWTAGECKCIGRLHDHGLGTAVKADTLIEAGLRMHQLERVFNCQCGLTRQDDRVSKAYYGRLRPEEIDAGDQFHRD